MFKIKFIAFTLMIDVSLFSITSAYSMDADQEERVNAPPVKHAEKDEVLFARLGTMTVYAGWAGKAEEIFNTTTNPIRKYRALENAVENCLIANPSRAKELAIIYVEDLKNYTTQSTLGWNLAPYLSDSMNEGAPFRYKYERMEKIANSPLPQATIQNGR